MWKALADKVEGESGSSSSDGTFRRFGLAGIGGLEGFQQSGSSGPPFAMSCLAEPLTVSCLTIVGSGSSSDNLSAHLSLALLLPLLESQSRADPELCARTAVILYGFLQTCPPLSLEVRLPDA